MRIGIIGAGGIARLHRRSYAAVEGAELAGVADVSAEAREQAAREWGVPAFETVEGLLDRAGPEAVSVCTPPNFHERAAVACLRRGVAVLCEKPLARNGDEAARIAEAAASSGAALMVAFCHRFHAPVVAVKEALDAGRLGAVRMVRNRFGGQQDMTARWFADPNIAGGGALMDTAIHSADLFRFLAGDVAWVDAAVTAFDSRYRLEDSGVITLGAEGGALGVIEASWSTPNSANVLEVYGSEGAAVVDYNTGETRIWGKDDADWHPVTTSGPDRFQREVEAFLKAVREKAAPPVTAADGVAANRILDAAYRSAREARRVEL